MEVSKEIEEMRECLKKKADAFIKKLFFIKKFFDHNDCNRCIVVDDDGNIIDIISNEDNPLPEYKEISVIEKKEEE